MVLALDGDTMGGDREEEVSVAHGLGEHEHPVERQRGERGERELRGGELRAGLTRGERRQHVAKVAKVAKVTTVASAAPLPSALNNVTP